MAIRNTILGGTDWTDGDVLYGTSDLNDTFDAATGSGNVEVNVFAPTSVGAGTWTRHVNTEFIYNGSYTNESADANGDNVTYTATLLPGTYDIRIMGYVSTESAIMDVLVDGSSVGTIDWYASGVTTNALKELTGVTVSARGPISIQILVNGHNGSSSAYRLDLQSLSFVRTGA